MASNYDIGTLTACIAPIVCMTSYNYKSGTATIHITPHVESKTEPSEARLQVSYQRLSDSKTFERDMRSEELFKCHPILAINSRVLPELVDQCPRLADAGADDATPPSTTWSIYLGAQTIEVRVELFPQSLGGGLVAAEPNCAALALEVAELKESLRQAHDTIRMLREPRLLRSLKIPVYTFITDKEIMHRWLYTWSASFRKYCAGRPHNLDQALSEYLPANNLQRLLFNMKWLSTTNVEVVDLTPDANGYTLSGSSLRAIVAAGSANYKLEALEWHQTLTVVADHFVLGGEQIALCAPPVAGGGERQGYRTVVYKTQVSPE